MSNEGYHEPVGELTAATRDYHRAIVSLMEELEAVDWYNQRIDACRDEELKAILVHNRDEEKEHAAMMLEWLGTEPCQRVATQIRQAITRVLSNPASRTPDLGGTLSTAEITELILHAL